MTTGGKSAKPFRAPLPLPSSCPSGQPWSPRQARAAPGSSAVWWGPHPSPPSSGRGTHWRHPHPTQAARSRDEGAEIPGGWGVSPSPGSSLPPGKSECLYLTEVIKVGGGEWRTARVCKPIRGGWGPELLAAAEKGIRQAPSRRSPDQPSQSG